MCTSSMLQSLNIKEPKLLELHITQTRHPKRWSGPTTRPALPQGHAGNYQTHLHTRDDQKVLGPLYFPLPGNETLTITFQYNLP